MSQSQILNQILYRDEKRSLLDIERSFMGVTMEPGVAKIYEQKKVNVAELEKKLGKIPPTQFLG